MTIVRRSWFPLSGVCVLAALAAACSSAAPPVAEQTAQTRAPLRNTLGLRAMPAVVQNGTTWALRSSQTTGRADTTFTYAPASGIPVMGDWDGDGIRTPGVFAGGVWYLRNSDTSGDAESVFSYGDAGDVPIVGDWNGDGHETVGVVRGTTWYLRNSNSHGAADVTFVYGDIGDVPVTGDWDGNGTATPGVFRNGMWYLRNSNSYGVGDVAFAYGNPGDTPIAGDWDGDGTDTPGVVRGNTWYLRNANTTGVADVSFDYGNVGDVALAGKWTGPCGAFPNVIGRAVVNDDLIVSWIVTRAPQPGGYGTVVVDGVAHTQWYGDDGIGVGDVTGPIVTLSTPATHTLTIPPGGSCPTVSATISLPPQAPVAPELFLTASPTSINAGASTTLTWGSRTIDPMTGCEPWTNVLRATRVSDGAVLWEKTTYANYSLVDSPSATTDYTMTAACAHTPHVKAVQTVRVTVSGTISQSACYAGYAGASTVTVTNDSSDPQTVWLADVASGAWSLQGRLPNTGDALTVRPPNDCRFVEIVVVDDRWVYDYDATFGTTYSPIDASTAATVNFQKAWATFVERSADPAGAIVVFD